MNTIRTYSALLVLAAAVLVLAACGGSSNSDAGAAASNDSTGATVAVRDVDGVGEVLVDAQGAALYAADQETNGTVACTDGCTSIWDPLTVSDGSRPAAGDGVSGTLGTAARPDGTQQVTLDGRLLYRFVEDPGPATVTGNGFADTFDGQAFVWHVVTPAGVATSSENSAPSSGLYGP
jgi:predicted lipoprotein with Yx(FWY)xxD motif